MGAGSRRPVLAVRRGPEADTLTTAASRQVACKPHAQFQVVNHDRIAKVLSMAAAKRRRQDFGKRGAAVGRDRRTRIVGPVMVVIVDYDGVVTRFSAVKHHALTLGA